MDSEQSAAFGGDLFRCPGRLPDDLHVRFDDGDQSWVRPDQVAPLDLEVGDRVFARWQRGPAYRPGRITRMQGERIHVQYDDGAQEWTTIGLVRVLRP